MADTERESVDILRVCPTQLTKIYFSKTNLHTIQNQLARAVKAKTGYAIDRQSDREILGIMRGVYDMFSTNVYADGEVQRLNDIVLDIATGQVVSGVEGYLNYLKDASSLPVPLSRGQFVSTKGDKSLEYKIGFT